MGNSACCDEKAKTLNGRSRKDNKRGQSIGGINTKVQEKKARKRI
jgi:hypothetical protein